jgi:hypothetical protein
MKRLLFAGLVTLTSSHAWAQAPDPALAQSTRPRAVDGGDTVLATPSGQHVYVSLSRYRYTEPGSQSISIQGTKIGAEYVNTVSLGHRHHWFAQADVRGTVGDVTYDGWCSPWLITPNGASPNGYALDTGNPFSCREAGDRDWYVEGRALVGPDLVGSERGWSPYAGVGLRHLSNGTGGVPGYRTDDYLYLPLGVTVRARVAPHDVLGITLEFDRLLHGWQHTHDSALGGGDLPATSTAPGFTINGFTDVSFAQSGGWALRASARYQMRGDWSVEPYYVRWHVGASPVNSETATFTVNGITAQEQLGAYEPTNVTDEFGVKLGVRF